MSDRAEQVKALIAQLISNADAHREPEGTERRRAAAALSASEAEVTRLQAGIAEAKAMWGMVGDTEDDGRAMYEALEALSQPTTDTNGAHA